MWSGSAALRALVPAMVSTGVAWIYWENWPSLDEIIVNTYTIAVMIGFFGFLLTTRLNFAYLRWWEAASMLHQLTSKLTDSASCLAAFHYQSHLWEQPQSFGQENLQETLADDVMKSPSLDAALDGKTMVAGGQTPTTQPQDVISNDNVTATGLTSSNRGGGVFRWVQENFFATLAYAVKTTDGEEDDKTDEDKKKASLADLRKENRRTQSEPNVLVTKSFQPNRQAFSSQRSIAPQRSQSDFLEEMVHLYSLLNAVALASLRHDVEGCPSPLSEYQEGKPLPPFNSEFYGEEAQDTPMQNIVCRQSYDQLWNLIYFLAGLDRSPKQKTLYNAARPFSVLGGVSEAEAKRLQLARGTMAQIALCQLWLKEFIAREYLHGSTGDVAPPIVGRVFHFMTDAMAAYHQCRKVAYIPFPFVHEQLTRFFTVVVIFGFPLLYVSFVNTKFMALLLNFVTLLCFQGIYEVARELSNPYDAVPNDLPLNRFHEEFNECLRTLLTGFHPDSKSKDIKDRWRRFDVR